MLRQIYLKAELGAKNIPHHSVNRRTAKHSKTCSHRIRACFLLTSWKSKNIENSQSNSLTASSSLSPNTSNHLNVSTKEEHNHLKNSSSASKNLNDNQTSIIKPVIEDENQNVLIGHVNDPTDTDEDARIKVDQTNPNNLNRTFSFNNSKENVKKRSSNRNFCRTKSAIKKRLSRLVSDKESATVGDSARSAYLEQHTSGHHRSILVSFRAASILLPLYGLHYLVFVYRLDTT